MKKLFIAINTIVIAAALSLSLFAQAQNDRPQVAKPDASKMRVAQKVSLGCKNPGSHQDVAKTPSVSNTTGKVLKKGTKLNWSASDGDKGVITLANDLAAGGSVQAMGSAGNGYTCQAWTMQ
ncbi:MAG: hypothetical protein ACKVZH_19550 [Blastocatellia bacterium]